MKDTPIEITTGDGVCPCEFFAPPQGGTRPAVIVYMDAFGVRPALKEMAARFARSGYYVLLPNLYYRAGTVPAFSPAKGFADPAERERMQPFFKSLNNALVTRDSGSFLAFLDRRPETAGQKVGCVGYCMGGGFALSAAGTYPDRVKAAASLHGARLANDAPDSPHLLAPKMQAEVYVGIAGLDQHFTPEEKQRLESALSAGHVRHTVEVYEGAKHGFAVNDMPVFDQAASEKHWERVLDLFARNLK